MTQEQKIEGSDPVLVRKTTRVKVAILALQLLHVALVIITIGFDHQINQAHLSA